MLAAVKLECTLAGSDTAVSSDLDAVTYYQYDSADTYRRAVSAMFTANQQSDCSVGPGQSGYSVTTSTGRTRSGLLGCETYDSGITLTSSTDQLWTIDVAVSAYGSSYGYPEMKRVWRRIRSAILTPTCRSVP